MFGRIHLQNFKSFSDIELDLNRVRGEQYRLAMIYGENGAGKTNLIQSIYFLKLTAHTFHSQGPIEGEEGSKTAASAQLGTGVKAIDEAYSQLLSLINLSLNKEYKPPLLLYASRYKAYESDTMSVEFEFYVEGRRTVYRMDFDAEGRIVLESLQSVVSSRFGNVYTISRGKEEIDARISPLFISDKGYRDEVQDLIVRYWGNNTLLSLMNDQYETKNAEFMAGSVSAAFDDIRRYIDSIIVLIPSDRGNMDAQTNYWNGWTNDVSKLHLEAYESAYNDFFRSIDGCTDRVHYNIEKHDSGTHYYLVFDKTVSGKECHIPFTQESTGLTKLATLLPSLAATAAGMDVFIDEMDSGIHDLMMTELVDSIKESITGQLVFTTHNTELLENADTGSTFAISIDPDGRRSISSFKKTARMQRTNSVRRQYLKGVFEGVPSIGYMDMGRIASMISEGKEKER